MSRKGHPHFCGVEQKSEMIWVNSFLRDSGEALAPSCVRRPVGVPIGALEKNFGKIRELSSLLDRWGAIMRSYRKTEKDIGEFQKSFLNSSLKCDKI